jgi:photosystem II stability/assembly factor-like uncharacterized protein
MSVCLSPNGSNTFHEREAPRRVLVGTRDGVVTLDRNGATWQRTGHSLPGSHIATLMREGDTVFAGIHGSGLHASTDDGMTWEPRMRGLAHQHVFALAASGATVYAGTAPPHLYKSDDQGHTWHELPALASLPGREQWTFGPENLPHIKHITFDPRDRQTLWVCVEQGALLKSTDGGATWMELDGFYDAERFKFYKDVHRVVFDPHDASSIFVTGGDGLMHSADSGASWDRLTTREHRIGYPDALFFSPDGRDMIMSGAASFPGSWREKGTANATIMKSRDRGRTWQAMDRGLPSHLANNIEATTMVSWPGGWGFFIATLDGNIHMSENGGESWALIASGLPLIAKAHHWRYLQTA